MSSGLFTPDQALAHVLDHARVVEGLVGGHIFSAFRDLPRETLETALGSAVELVDVLQKLDDLLRRGGQLPSAWHAAYH